MALNITDHFNALLSVASSTGLFESVSGFEPKSAPSGSGLSASVWGSEVAPVPQVSGLNKVSVRAELQLRVHQNMLQEPQEGIDLEVIGAAGQLMEALAGGYTLGGVAMAVDLLGAFGESLRMVTGYVSIGSSMFRVADVYVPIIIADVWEVAG